MTSRNQARWHMSLPRTSTSTDLRSCTTLQTLRRSRPPRRMAAPPTPVAIPVAIPVGTLRTRTKMEGTMAIQSFKACRHTSETLDSLTIERSAELHHTKRSCYAVMGHLRALFYSRLRSPCFSFPFMLVAPTVLVIPLFYFPRFPIETRRLRTPFPSPLSLHRNSSLSP